MVTHWYLHGNTQVSEWQLAFLKLNAYFMVICQFLLLPFASFAIFVR